MQRTKRPPKVTDMKSANQPDYKDDEKRAKIVMEGKIENKKTFKYKLDGDELNIKFMLNKRVKCPKCRNDFKNIFSHLHRSGCTVSNLEDFREKYKQYTKINLAKEIKEDMRKQKAKSSAKQK